MNLDYLDSILFITQETKNIMMYFNFFNLKNLK